MTNDLRCSPWTRAQGVDPIGTATPFDALLLVEWPLPWPRDVSEIAALAPAAADGRASVMAVVPQHHDPGAVEMLVRVVHHRRIGTHRFAGVDHVVPRTEVPDLLARLLDDVTGDHLDWPSAAGESPADVLVCAHGRRDPCCGSSGTVLHAALAAARPDVRVWRCSHTGGHRFAPTAITMTDGRTWAYLDPELLMGILDRSVAVGDLAGHDRGTMALPSWAQAVEHALFAANGWAWLDGEVTDARTVVADDRRSAQVALTWRDASGAEHDATAEVVVTRDIPVLVCGEPPEQAKKTSVELAVRGLEVRAR
jgi:hypothetical protein